MASKVEVIDTKAAAPQKKSFRKSLYRGIELEKLVDMNMD